jgi:hypothetical protein
VFCHEFAAARVVLASKPYVQPTSARASRVDSAREAYLLCSWLRLASSKLHHGQLFIESPCVHSTRHGASMCGCG